MSEQDHNQDAPGAVEPDQDLGVTPAEDDVNPTQTVEAAIAANAKSKAADVAPAEEEAPAEKEEVTEHRTSPGELHLKPKNGTVRAVGQFNVAGPSKKFTPLNFFSMRYQGLEETLSQSIPDGINDPTGQWAASMHEAPNTQVYDGRLDVASDRPGAEWAHTLVYGGREFGPSQRTPKSVSGTHARGRAAVDRITAKTTGAKFFMQPLWGSGFWVELVTSTLDADIKLDMQQTSDLATLGRQTRGRVFTMDSAVTIRNMMAHIYDHIVDTSVGGLEYDEFLSLVKLPSVQLLAIAMAHVKYPSGYPYAHPCTFDITKCTHVIKDHVAIAKLGWVDASRIYSDNTLLAHIAKRTNMKEEEVLKYQETIYGGVDAIIDLDGVRIVMEVPSVKKFLDDSNRWFVEIEQFTKEAFGTSINPDAREAYIQSRYEANLLRSYGSWIKHIEIVEEDDGVEEVTVVDAREDIDQQLIIWSGDNDILEKIIDRIEKYQNDAIVELAAVPNFECPGCKKWQHAAEGAWNSVIPVDAVSVFFHVQQSYLDMTQKERK